jgi:hypothetical protein
MELPRGVNMSVPDLSQFTRPKPDKPLIAITIKPGDRVMVLLPQQASQQEVAQVSEYLKSWAPETIFLVLSGPESITVIPADPVEDKAPQGPKPFFEQVKEVKEIVADANEIQVTALGPDETCYCMGAQELHRKGTGELCAYRPTIERGGV